MATTTNFGWETPDDTDLVKDGAAAIRTALGGVDTSFVDLKGGTTGQVLTKASNTDLDYSWTAVDPLIILDAKGDLISATAADTPARLAVGTNGQILTADSTTATGLKWASPAGGGKVLQVVTGTTSTEVSTSSSTYADTGLTATITPSATSSKILVMWTHNGGFRTATANIAADIKLFRGATEIQYSKDNAFTGAANALGFTVASSIVDSPATTSATTYKTQFATSNAGSTVILQRGSSGPSTMILLEIGA